MKKLAGPNRTHKTTNTPNRGLYLMRGTQTTKGIRPPPRHDAATTNPDQIGIEQPKSQAESPRHNSPALVPSADAQPEGAPLPQLIEPEPSEAPEASPDPAIVPDATTNDALWNGDEADARMEEIQKTLGHAAMHLLDRYALVTEWVRHAEAKASVYDQNVAKPEGGRPKGGVSRAAEELPVPGKTLLGRRKYIERAIKIASMWEEAKSAARAAGLDNIQSALFAIAHEHSPEAQLAKVQEIAARRSAPRRKRGNANQTAMTNDAAQLNSSPRCF